MGHLSNLNIVPESNFDMRKSSAKKKQMFINESKFLSQTASGTIDMRASFKQTNYENFINEEDRRVNSRENSPGGKKQR